MHIEKIYGAPGTGKTTTLLNILDDELKGGTKPNRIAYVTFSVAAKLEALDRVKRRFPGFNQSDLVFFRTIHGICYYEIGMSASCMMQVEDYLKFAKYSNMPFSNNYTEDFDMDGLPIGYSASLGNSILNIRQVAASRQIDPFSNRCMELDWPANVKPEQVKYLLNKYEQYKMELGKADFVDLLEIYQRLGEPIDVDVAFIDEAQDLSSLQWDIIHKMFANVRRLYVAGDDDQEIYAFLGSDSARFHSMESNSKTILGTTYRLTQSVWDMGNSIISRVRKREHKDIKPRGDGPKPQQWGISIGSVIEHVKSDDILVITSNNYQIAEIKDGLEAQGINFDYKGRSITGTQEALTFYWYNKIRKGSSIPIRQAAAILRSIGLPGAKELLNKAREDAEATISPAQMQGYGVEFIHGRGMCSYLSGKNKTRVAKYDTLYSMASRSGLESIIETPKIRLTTYHGAKGLEADCVILGSDCSPAAAKNFEIDPDYERRIAYVGVTRAIRELHICNPQTPYYIRPLNEVRT